MRKKITNRKRSRVRSPARAEKIYIDLKWMVFVLKGEIKAMYILIEMFSVPTSEKQKYY
jgi:hypothetical protein